MESCNYIVSEHLKEEPVFEEQIIQILNDFQSPFNFHKILTGYDPSPFYSLPGLASKLGFGVINLKNEAERFGIGAIKMLGASYAINKLLKKRPEIKSFCTATDGNHGRSVAWSAAKHKRKAFIFVPEYTVASRIRKIEDEDGLVTVIKGNYDAAVIAALNYSQETNSVLVQDFSFNDYREIPALITAGYYTQMKELEEQTDNFTQIPDLILVQCGNGTWPSAVVHFVRRHPKLKEIKIICVEPVAAECMLRSVKSGNTVTIPAGKTIMAGLNCGTPSELAFEILCHGVDAFLAIPDNYAIEAMKSLYHPIQGDPKIEAGESGAAGLAGLIALMNDPNLKILRKLCEINSSTRVLLFNTEGITDEEYFKKFVF